MTDLFHSIVSIESPFNMIVLVVLIGSIAGVISSIAKQIRKYACHCGETRLKRELVERGLSVEEIERIVTAKLPSERQGDD
jgi:hypothetical protein